MLTLTPDINRGMLLGACGECGRLSVAKLVLEQDDIDLNRVNDYRRTPL